MSARKQRPSTDDIADPREARVSRLRPPQRVAFSRHGMVASAHFRATDAGVRILEEGGNAVDAAAAVAFALGVCEPAASGLGGQTMMMIRVDGSLLALDGSSRAPHRTMLEQLGKTELLTGHRATTVPSTPATLAYAVERYGKLPLSAVLEPARELAENGFEVTELLHGLTRRVRKKLRASAAGALFLHDNKLPAVGSTLRQPVLAATLTRLQQHGIEDFYTGEIARTIHDDMERNDGLIQLDDLAQIPVPIERRPIATRFDNMRVLTFPPPAAGRTLVEMLNILSEFSEKRTNLDTPEGAVLLAHVIRQAYRDRRDRPFDPAYYPQTDDKKMLDPTHAKRAARRIRRAAQRGETTHLSVMDGADNVVALTQSIERVYGSCAASPELGFLYNNYMSAFDVTDISHPYYLRPNAVPWASVAPTIVMRGRSPWLAIGSPGSERIAPSLVQVLLRLRRQGPYDAVAAPRLHCSLDGTVSLEAARMRDDIPSALVRAGFSIDEREDYSFYLGCVQLVLRERDGYTGVADLRRDGSARGPSGA